VHARWKIMLINIYSFLGINIVKILYVSALIICAIIYANALNRLHARVHALLQNRFNRQILLTLFTSLLHNFSR
jgi:hypothetical protein